MRMHSFLHAKGKACYRHPVRFASPKGEMDKPAEAALPTGGDNTFKPRHQ